MPWLIPGRSKLVPVGGYYVTVATPHSTVTAPWHGPPLSRRPADDRGGEKQQELHLSSQVKYPVPEYGEVQYSVHSTWWEVQHGSFNTRQNANVGHGKWGCQVLQARAFTNHPCSRSAPNVGTILQLSTEHVRSTTQPGSLA